MTTNPYEDERRANVARNEEYMRSIGMVDAVAELKLKKLQAKKTKRVKAKTLTPQQPTRRGARNEGKVVKYTFDHSDRALGIERKSNPRGPGTVVWDNSNCFNRKLAEAATVRAEAFAAQSELAHCVKMLLKSHVSVRSLYHMHA